MKLDAAIETLGLLGRLTMRVIDAIRRGEPERVEDILPAKDRARLHLLDLEAQAREDLAGGAGK